MSKQGPAKTIMLTGALISSAAAAYWFLARPWMASWGSTPAENGRPYPGDDLIPDARLVSNHTVTIQAAPEHIWPWLLQWGYQRGGFYSYDWIDRALGSDDVVSADRILPEFQHLEIGDEVKIFDEGGFIVHDIEPQRHLVLHFQMDPTTGQGNQFDKPRPEHFFEGVWGWHLLPLSPTTTRLTSHWRLNWSDEPQNHIYMRAFLEPGSFIMDRRMLLGIRQRAEALARAPQSL